MTRNGRGTIRFRHALRSTEGERPGPVSDHITHDAT
jgi:hypothetical protein